MKRAFLVLLLLACAQAIPAQTRPATENLIHWWEPEQVKPTTMHRLLYSMVANCLGVEDDDATFRGISWFLADFILRSSDMARLGGLWIRDSRRIFLDRRLTANDPFSISHELIHDLTDGNIEHGDPTFARCEVREWSP